MVNLDSYDSEGPLTPETDDSTEVRHEKNILYRALNEKNLRMNQAQK